MYAKNWLIPEHDTSIIEFLMLQISNSSDEQDWQSLWRCFEDTLRQSSNTILKFNKMDSSYGWFDTKLDLRTGKHNDASDVIRGQSVVYGWVQGRALEAFARHVRWWERQSHDENATRLAKQFRDVLTKLVESIESRRQAHGRLSFMMALDGSPLDMAEGRPVPAAASAKPSSLTDLFYCKGLAEAGDLLGRTDLLRQGEVLLSQVLDDIKSDRLWLDQIGFDPNNKVGDVPGRHSQAPLMLGIAAAGRVGGLTGNRGLIETAGQFADLLLKKHVAHDGHPALRPGDFWEFTNDEGEPYIKDNVLHSDPGHAIEAAGFCLKLLSVPGVSKVIETEEKYAEHWVRVLIQNFENGWAANGIGVVKAFDLHQRKAIYNQVPWWPLPETMRSSVLALPYASKTQREIIKEAFILSTNALYQNFIQPETGLATQSLDTDGNVLDTIPAVPDADPGYHTNICLIDVLGLVDRMRWQNGLPA